MYKKDIISKEFIKIKKELYNPDHFKDDLFDCEMPIINDIIINKLYNIIHKYNNDDYYNLINDFTEDKVISYFNKIDMG